MSLKDEGVLFSSKFLSDSNSLLYLDKYFEALASILMLNKSIDDGIGEDESVSKILKVFKVHIFWEGHKILQNLHLNFVLLCSASQK